MVVQARFLPNFSRKLTHVPHLFTMAAKAMTIRPVSRIRTCSLAIPRWRVITPGHLKWRCQKLIWVVRKYAGDAGDAFQSFVTVIRSSKRRPEVLTQAVNSELLRNRWRFGIWILETAAVQVRQLLLLNFLIFYLVTCAVWRDTGSFNRSTYWRYTKPSRRHTKERSSENH